MGKRIKKEISVIGAPGVGSLLKVKKQEHNGMLDHMIIRAAEGAEHANTNQPGAPILGSARQAHYLVTKVQSLEPELGALAGSAAHQANTHQYI